MYYKYRIQVQHSILNEIYDQTIHTVEIALSMLQTLNSPSGIDKGQ